MGPGRRIWGGVAFERYLSVYGGMEMGVFTCICAHVCMEVRGWCTVSHGHSLPQWSNFLGTETFHPGEQFLKTQKVAEGGSL